MGFVGHERGTKLYLRQQLVQLVVRVAWGVNPKESSCPKAMVSAKTGLRQGFDPRFVDKGFDLG